MAYNFGEMEECANEIAVEIQNATTSAAANISNQAQCNWNLPPSYFELNNSTVSAEALLTSIISIFFAILIFFL